MGSPLNQYNEVNAIFENSPVEGTTTKERTICVHEARRDNYLALVTRPPKSPDKPIFFSEEDACSMHFPHNDALVMIVHIDCCKVLKILVNGGVASISCMIML